MENLAAVNTIEGDVTHDHNVEKNTSKFNHSFFKWEVSRAQPLRIKHVEYISNKNMSNQSEIFTLSALCFLQS